MAKHPTRYATLRDLDDDGVCVLRNNEGEQLTVTREAAGDVAIMLAEWVTDPDLAEFVADQWRGQADTLRYEEEDDEDLSLLREERFQGEEDEDQTMVDLGKETEE